MTNDPEEAPTKPSGPPPELRRLGLTLRVGLILWVGFRFIGPSVWPELNPDHIIKKADQPVAAPMPPPPAAQEPRSDTPVADLEARIKLLEEMPGSAKNDTQIKPLEAMPDATKTDARLDAIEQQLKQQQEALAALQNQLHNSAQQVAIVTLFGQLKEAAMRDEPFSEPLNQLSQLTKANLQAQDYITKLATHAGNDTLTRAALQKSFDDAVQQSLHPHDKNTWTANIHSLVRIRKVGEEQKGNDTESVIARAEAKLQRGEIEQTLKELRQLPAPAADGFAQWIKQADSYLDLKKNIDALQLILLTPAPTPVAEEKL